MLYGVIETFRERAKDKVCTNCLAMGRMLPEVLAHMDS